MFTKDQFLEIIEALFEQHKYDAGYAKLMEQVLMSENVPTYNNHIVTNLLLKLLQQQFPPKNGDCEIERYCYVQNFGFEDGVQVIVPEMLWDRLNEVA